MSLTAKYECENVASSICTDSSVNGKHGTVNGSITPIAGKIGTNCYDFNGGDISLPTGIIASNDFSISFWLKDIAPTNPHGNIIKLFDFRGEFQVFVQVETDGKLTFSITNANGTYTAQTPGGIRNEVWNNFALVKRSTGTALEIYIDARSMATNTDPNANAACSVATTSSYMGLNTDGSTERFWGEIDQVQLYNHVLTESEIIALIREGTDSPFTWTETLGIATVTSAADINENKTKIDTLRSATGAGGYSWGNNPVTVSNFINVNSIVEQKTALDGADTNNYCQAHYGNYHSSWNNARYGTVFSGHDVPL